MPTRPWPRALAARLGGAARSADTPAALAEGCDIVITMLPNGQVVQQVALGEQGLLQGLKPGALLLDTSSAEPWLTRQTAAALAERGVAMVDAPVSGAQWGAQEANLVFMVGGDAADRGARAPAARADGPRGASTSARSAPAMR